MRFLDRFSIPLGDFLKNAGIVGFRYMLKEAGAKEEVDFGISENGQELWVDLKYALNADWTNMYFKACINYFGPSTVYQGVIDKIQLCLDKIQADNWNPGKIEKDDLKFINENLLSNSYQAAFGNIKGDIKNPEVYLTLKEDELSDKFSSEELSKRLVELQNFLKQSKCKEAFIMKSVILKYIKCFWGGKSFLLPNAKGKDMWEMFEKDFSEPFRKYLITEHKKAKDLCIDCSSPILSKEKVSITFMNDVGDDFIRKRSAFWNCKVDAFLCPVCAFVYALSPLGFRLFANEFVFMNINNDISTLLEVNSKAEDASKEVEREKDQKYSQWFAETINILLEKKVQEVSNVQVILRRIKLEDKYLLREDAYSDSKLSSRSKSEDRYLLNIIHKSTLNIISESEVFEALESLVKCPRVKIKNEYVNIHEEVVMNLFKSCNQYQLLNRLLKESIENNKICFYANMVYTVQIWSEIKRKELIMSSEDDKKTYNIEEKRTGKELAKNMKDSTDIMKSSGIKLGKVIMRKKKSESGECLKGIEYQLLNTLSVRNTEKFMDIVLRLYSAYGDEKDDKGNNILVPKELVEMLKDEEKFKEYGYAFVLGLESCCNEKYFANNANRKENNISEGGN